MKFAGQSLEQIETHDCCSLSQRERPLAHRMGEGGVSRVRECPKDCVRESATVNCGHKILKTL
jgi:hypothetical protein